MNINNKKKINKNVYLLHLYYIVGVLKTRSINGRKMFKFDMKKTCSIHLYAFIFFSEILMTTR